MTLLTFKRFFIFCILFITACNNIKDDPSNIIFEKFLPTSREYKNELAKQLKLNSNGIVYNLNKYLEIKGQEYLDVQIKADHFMATGHVLINSWNKLEGIKRTKGLGYSGAELRGLKLDIKEDPLGAVFIYKDLEKIVD